MRRYFIFLFVLAACAPTGYAAAKVQASSETLHAVTFEGNTVISSTEIAKRLSVKPGDPYNEKQVGFSASLIEALYREHGYADSRVRAEAVHHPPREVDVTFRIFEGALYTIHSIGVQGNHLLSERVIKRQMGLRVGQPFSQTAIYAATRQLFLAGYFENIDLRVSSGPAQGMDVTAHVSERPTRFAKGGLGYGATTKERVSLGYEDRNIFGNTRQLELQATHSGFLTSPSKYRTTILEANLTQPYVFNTLAQGQTGISEEWDNRQAYDARTTTWRTSFGRRLGENITGNVHYRYQGIQLIRVDPSFAATTQGFTNVSAIGPDFTYDDTNDPFLPTHGWRVNAGVEKGMSILVGTLPFYKATSRVGRFDTLPGKWISFLGLQSAWERPDHASATMPIFERFTLGGANTVRGYEERELGPKDIEGNPAGGEAFLAGNVELRHRLYKQLFGVTFLDGGQLYQRPAGNAWPFIKASGIGDFQYGTGGGIRLTTPVGAVRLEVGYKLNPPNGPEDTLHRLAIHFSIGELF